ncbi:hypothetical protein D2A34_21915 [Clostridium chromiireducens]|uniref:Phage late control D family protein n=1 Tax=Clostridium chromiireducens TaxID=225345 RepID=A0A399IIL0_9CLOT|nr:hypothetical protein [Clostridium chromiireducens]RII32854.1 hypothetical protein D2A34_21915 [Clostridium chromiireducens]
MKLVYEDKDISDYINFSKAEFTDNAGNVADSVELILNDPKGTWSDWNPKKNDKLIISQDGLSTGTMYIDEIGQQRGTFILRALSIPQKAKNSNTQSWETVRFLEFATEIALRYGFSIETYGIENYLYERVDQYEESDFVFLARRCLLEGYVLKIADNKVIIYDESYIESQSAKEIYASLFDGDYKFLNKSSEIYNSCELMCGGMKASYSPSNAPNGPILKCSDIYFYSLDEGNRFAKNILRSKNKYETTGVFALKLNTELTAGSNTSITGVGILDGKYICEQTRHNFVNDGRTNFRVRKILEGY